MLACYTSISPCYFLFRHHDLEPLRCPVPPTSPHHLPPLKTVHTIQRTTGSMNICRMEPHTLRPSSWPCRAPVEPHKQPEKHRVMNGRHPHATELAFCPSTVTLLPHSLESSSSRRTWRCHLIMPSSLGSLGFFISTISYHSEMNFYQQLYFHDFLLKFPLKRFLDTLTILGCNLCFCMNLPDSHAAVRNQVLPRNRNLSCPAKKQEAFQCRIFRQLIHLFYKQSLTEHRRKILLPFPLSAL